MNQKTYLVAHTFQQARYVARELLGLRPSEWVWVDNPVKIKGLYRPFVVFVDAPRHAPTERELEVRSAARIVARERCALIHDISLP